MDDRSRERLEAMTPDERAKAEAALARLRTPAARAGRAAAAAAVEAEVRGVGGVEGPDGRVRRVRTPDPAAADERAFELVAVGRAFRERRAAAGRSLEDVAAESGIDQSALAKIERGANPNPTVGTLARVASALGARITIAVESAEGER